MNRAVAFHEDLAANWGKKYSNAAFISRERVVAECLDALSLRSTVWLDAGCGSGHLSQLLATRGCHVTGVDAAPSMIEHAILAARAHGCDDRLVFRHIETVESLPFTADAFDGILCSSVLEYLPDPEGCLRGFCRVLKPGGTLLISVPNRGSLLRKLLLAVFRVSRRMRGRGWPAYMEFSVNEYSRSQFTQLLSDAGFGVAGVRHFGGPVPRVLQRLSVIGPLMLFVAQKKR